MIQQHINTINLYLSQGKVDQAIHEFRELAMFMQGGAGNGSGLLRLSGKLVKDLGNVIAKMMYIMTQDRKNAYVPMVP